jgi:7,8-dihydroneopterin aldolase/epimerase/oxygenase
MEQISKNLVSRLNLNELTIPVHLGITKLEQKTTQPINLNISISQEPPPLGCDSDNIENTICYDKLCQKIKSLCQSKTYNLIEHLCNEIWVFIARYIKDIFNNDNNKFNLIVTVGKNPPIKNLKAANFSLSGEI